MTLRYAFYLCFIAYGSFSCVQAIEPELDLKSNLLFITGFALSEPGLTSVEIKRSALDGEVYSLPPVPNALVELEEINSGRQVNLQNDSSGIYLAPADFKVAVGESWKLNISLEDGTRYESTPEKVAGSVPIGDLNTEFFEQVKFDASRNKFLPGHEIRITWTDPAAEENFYLWKYRSFEKIQICKTCVNGRLRDGVCQGNQGPTSFFNYFNYLCDTTCWMIRYSEEFQIYEDVFSDGLTVEDRTVATVPYYRDRNVLVELQQLSLTESSYQYFRVINDLIVNSAGVNAPTPTPLFGNLKNPDDPSDIVLGQFVVSDVTTKRIFIDRSNLPVDPVGVAKPLQIEDCFNCPTEYPCMEGVFRTRIEPEGWME